MMYIFCSCTPQEMVQGTDVMWCDEGYDVLGGNRCISKKTSNHLHFHVSATT